MDLSEQNNSNSINHTNVAWQEIPVGGHNYLASDVIFLLPFIKTPESSIMFCSKEGGRFAWWNI